MILSLAGNTGEGIPMAARVLSSDALAAQLAGNYALINGDQILTANTMLGVGNNGVAEKVPGAVAATPLAQPTQAPAPAATAMPEIKGQPDWLLPSMIGTSAAFVIVLLLFIIRSLVSGAQSRALEKKMNQNQKGGSGK